MIKLALIGRFYLRGFDTGINSNVTSGDIIPRMATNITAALDKPLTHIDHTVDQEGKAEIFLQNLKSKYPTLEPFSIAQAEGFTKAENAGRYYVAMKGKVWLIWVNEIDQEDAHHKAFRLLEKAATERKQVQASGLFSWNK